MGLIQIRQSYVWVFLLPFLVVLCSIFLMLSPVFMQEPDGLSIGITLDLVFTAPILYLFLIRKKPISKLTVIPWVVGGILLAHNLLPAGYQSLASLAFNYLLPLIELTVISVIAFKVYQLVQSYKRLGSASKDFLTGVQQSTKEIFGEGLPVNLLAWEIAVFYYSLVQWRKPDYSVNHFTYHRKSPVKPILVALMVLVVIETVALHLLLQIWSPLAAWILTGLSIYSLFWILAQWKAMAFRPQILENDVLYLRNGMVLQTAIPLDQISQVSIVKKLNKEEGRMLSLLPDNETPNIKLVLQKPVLVTGLYGKSYHETALFIKLDDPGAFAEYLQEAMR